MAEFTNLNGYTVKDATARNIAKGRNQAVAYSDYATMVEALNAMDNEQFRTGQNIYIGTVGVPDLWVYSIEPIQHNFTYVSDEEAVEMLKNNVTIQVGFYRLAMLEGHKVDLTTVNAQLEEHDTKLSEHDTKLSEHDTKFTEVDEAISEQNKNIASIPRIECESGVVTQYQERRITLKNNYDKMLYFNVSHNDTDVKTSVSNVKFIAPNLVTFNVSIYKNGSFSVTEEGLSHNYIFVGE